MSNNKKENIIMWQKWKDPFGEKDDNIDMDDEYGNYYSDDDEDITDQKNKLEELLNNKQIKVIATPMGIVPINENTASGKIFNFWVGHTNFDITRNIFKIIETSEGVETLDVFTRYRFRIGIGKAFSDAVVMKNIQESIYSYIETYDDQEN